LRSPQGIAARAYLQQRGLDTETIERFELGLSPGGGSELLKHLSALGHPQEQVVRAGLVTQPSDASPRDMFLGRLMFPIRNDQGNLAGFGGRSLDGSEPKYLNSPRTEVFDKGRILYAFHRAKDRIKEQGEGVVVEGYMDAIAAHQYGFDNVVASMGTALTEAQVSLLKSVGKRFVMAMDSDAAGKEATFRSLRDSWHALAGFSDVLLSIALLPFGKDPDELIRTTSESWRRSVAESTPLLDYLFDSAPNRWDLSSSVGKQQAVDELKQVINRMGNVFEQDKYFRKLADTLDVSLATLEASMGRPHARSPRSRIPNRGQAPAASAKVFEDEKRDRIEEHLLALVLQWPDLREFVRDLDPQALERWENRELFTFWIGCSTIDELLQGVEEDLHQRVNYLLSLPVPPMDLRTREDAVKDCSHRLEERRLRTLKAEEALLWGQEEPLEEAQEQRAVDINEKLRALFHARSGHQRRG